MGGGLKTWQFMIAFLCLTVTLSFKREKEREGRIWGVNVLTRAESVKGTFPFNIHELSVLSAQTDLHCCLHMALAQPDLLIHMCPHTSYGDAHVCSGSVFGCAHFWVLTHKCGSRGGGLWEDEISSRKRGYVCNSILEYYYYCCMLSTMCNNLLHLSKIEWRPVHT